MTMRDIESATKKTEDHPWVVGFLEQLRREGLSPKTVLGYQNDLRSFVGWYQLPGVEELTAMDIRNYLRHAEEAGLQQASINRKIAALRRFCRWAHREGKLQENPAANLKLRSLVRDRRPVGLSDAEVKTLLRAAGRSEHRLDERNNALLHILLQSGLRVSEVAALRFGDVVLGKRAGSLKVQDGRKSRKIPLPAEVRSQLQAYLKTRHALKPEDALFTSETGAPLSVRSIQSVVSELGRRAKIARISLAPRSLRHTFALKLLEESSGNLVKLAALLGHKSLDTTAAYLRPFKTPHSD